MQTTTPTKFRNWKIKLDFLKLSNEQITVVKSTLQSINSTLLTVCKNELCLSKGLEEMANHINYQNEKNKGNVWFLFNSTDH